MAALKRSKRVTWPSNANLCKVRLFLSEDAPYQSGLGSQDHLQAKATWLLHAGGSNESNNSLPPGFESPYRNHPKIEKSQIPLIKWQFPHTLVLKQKWRVAAGEESQELHTENARQQGVLEAIYPRPSSIPPNPLVSPDVQISSTADDSSTLLVPITAPEDEDVTEQPEPVALSTTNHNAPVHSHSYLNAQANQLNFTSTDLHSHYNATSLVPLSSTVSTATVALGAEPDVAAAANAALTAVIKSSEEGSLVDHDLLIKLLREPSMLNKLLSDYNVPKPTQAAPSSTPSASHNFITSQALNHDTSLPTLPIRSSVEAVPLVKDANYYKNLIQLHGGDRQETSAIENVKPKDFKARVQKPCMYFNTPRGCRNGASCLFLHDARFVNKHSGPSKRVRLDGRI